MRNAVVCALAVLALAAGVWLVGCGDFTPTLPSPDAGAPPGNTIRIYGQVTQNNGAAPLYNALVTTSDGHGGGDARTDENGNYSIELENVTPGTRGLIFSHPDFATEYRVVVVEDTDVELNVDMSNPRADVTECPEIQLNPVDVDEESGLATVSGTVNNVDADQALLIHNGQASIIGLVPEALPEVAAAVPPGYTAASFETVVALQRGQNEIFILVSNAVCNTLSDAITVSWVPQNEFTFRVTLTWDTGEDTDVDLHVWNPDGTHCGWEMPNVGGSELDVDDIYGYGPENITVRAINPGRYRVAVNAWYLGDRLVHATVRITSGGLAQNALDITRGPHLFEHDRSEFAENYPVTGDEPQWWRVFDVVVEANGSVNVVPPDGVPLEEVWGSDDQDAYNARGIRPAGVTAGKRVR